MASADNAHREPIGRDESGRWACACVSGEGGREGGGGGDSSERRCGNPALSRWCTKCSITCTHSTAGRCSTPCHQCLLCAVQSIRTTRHRLRAARSIRHRRQHRRIHNAPRLHCALTALLCSRHSQRRGRPHRRQARLRCAEPLHLVCLARELARRADDETDGAFAFRQRQLLLLRRRPTRASTSARRDGRRYSQRRKRACPANMTAGTHSQALAHMRVLWVLHGAVLMAATLGTCSSAIMIMGRPKTIVLPDPVKAMPIMSRPDSTTGSPCTCARSLFQYLHSLLTTHSFRIYVSFLPY